MQRGGSRPSGDAKEMNNECQRVAGEGGQDKGKACQNPRQNYTEPAPLQSIFNFLAFFVATSKQK